MIVLLAAACSASQVDGPTTADGGPGTDVPATISQTVGSGGGRVATPYGVVLDVPEGALDGDTTITVTKATIAAPPGKRAAGPAFVFGPSGLTFKKTVVLTLPVDAAKLAGTASTQVSVATAPTAPTSCPCRLRSASTNRTW